MQTLKLNELTTGKKAYLIIDPDLHCWARPTEFCKRQGEVLVNSTEGEISSMWFNNGDFITLDTTDYGIKWRCEEL